MKINEQPWYIRLAAAPVLACCIAGLGIIAVPCIMVGAIVAPFMLVFTPKAINISVGDDK